MGKLPKLKNDIFLRRRKNIPAGTEVKVTKDYGSTIDVEAVVDGVEELFWVWPHELDYSDKWKVEAGG